MKRLLLVAALTVGAASFASAQVKINTQNLPDAYTNGLYYSQTLSATISGFLQATGTLTWSVAPGSVLPPGLTLDAAGNLTGFPTAPGLYNFNIKVQINFSDFTDQRPYSINVVVPNVKLVTDALPDAVITEQYQQTLLASTTPALPVLFTVPGGQLPPGFVLGPQGLLTGIAQTTGTYTFTVTAFLANTGINSSNTYTIRVFTGRVRITSEPLLPTATAGQSYTFQFSSSPGAGVTFASPGLLPFGLKLEANTGKLSGIPTVTGIYNFVIEAGAPNFSTDRRAYTLYVTEGPVSIREVTIPIALQSTFYSVQLTAVGGLAPYLWRATGDIPPGLSMNLNTGLLSGRPTTTGPFNFAIEVTDAAGSKFARLYSVFVAGPLAVLTTSLANGIAGVPYSQTLSGGGGQAPYTWTVLSGDLPPGLTFSSSGTITGAPTRNGFFQFTVLLTDNGSRFVSQNLSITVGGIAVLTSSLPDAGFGTGYQLNLAAVGGAAPYTWTLVSGSLPPGLTLDPGGVITGTPSLVGSFSFTVQVNDASQSSIQKQFTLNVALTLEIFTTSLPGASFGASYSQTLSARGGTPPYTWAVELGALPTGLSLDSATGVISGTPTSTTGSNFGILLSDKGSQVARHSFTVLIASPISITTPNLGGTLGAAFSQTLAATGGTAPYQWSIASGTLPAGLTLNGTTGLISGTPTAGGSFQVTLSVTDSQNLGAQTSITISIAVPPAPNVTIGGIGDTAAAAQQPAVTVTLSSAYPAAITGTLTLTFQSSVGGDDQSVRFSNGTRIASFTIPAGSTQVTAGNVLTGTTAGAITLLANLKVSGTDITPSPAPSKKTTLDTAVPVITSVVLQQTSGGVTVVVTGYSNTREMSNGLFHFAPATGSTLSQSDLTVSLGSAFAAWYGNAASTATGTQFTLTMPFTVQGNAGSITAVTVSLSNAKGTSTPVSPQ